MRDLWPPRAIPTAICLCHIRNIFRKVNVASRVELARAVERADSAEHPPSP